MKNYLEVHAIKIEKKSTFLTNWLSIEATGGFCARHFSNLLQAKVITGIISHPTPYKYIYFVESFKNNNNYTSDIRVSPWLSWLDKLLILQKLKDALGKNIPSFYMIESIKNYILPTK